MTLSTGVCSHRQRNGLAVASKMLARCQDGLVVGWEDRQIEKNEA